jgi:hypothetical protein
MAVVAKGTMVVILNSAGDTLRGAFIALADVDLDALLATNPRAQDLAPFFVQIVPTYWINWLAAHPEFTWRDIFSDRLVAESAGGRFSKFTVAG